jgi:hypothetical protein
MQSANKKRLMREVMSVPDEIVPNLTRIIRLLKKELPQNGKKDSARGSLKGIWKGSRIDNSIIADSKRTLFPYEYSHSNL